MVKTCFIRQSRNYMNNITDEIKYHTRNICSSMLRNINDNFKNVSFRVDSKGYISLRIVLLNRTETEENYIEDMVGELSAFKDSERIKEVQIMVGNEHLPLENLVYSLK